MLFPFQEVGKSRENVRNVAKEKVPNNFVAGRLLRICSSTAFVRLGKVWGRKGMTAEVYFTSPLCYLLRELFMLCTRTEFLHRLRGISAYIQFSVEVFHFA